MLFTFEIWAKIPFITLKSRPQKHKKRPIYEARFCFGTYWHFYYMNFAIKIIDFAPIVRGPLRNNDASVQGVVFYTSTNLIGICSGARGIIFSMHERYVSIRI